MSIVEASSSVARQPSKRWFDYTLEMNAVLTAFEKRIFNMEIALQFNSNIIKMDDSLSSRSMNTMVASSFDARSNTIARSSKADNPTLPSTLSSSVLPLSDLTPRQVKMHGYEVAAIFEDTFDQLTILRQGLFLFNGTDSTLDILSRQLTKITDKDESNCNSIALNLAGIFLMNERDKLGYEIEEFFRALMQCFRSLLVDSNSNLTKFIDSTHTNLPSTQIVEFHNQLKISRDRMKQLKFMKKHFQNETNEQFQIISLDKAKLKDHLMEQKYRSKIAIRYCDDWKTNHINQWTEMLRRIEQIYITRIHQIERELKQSAITHQISMQMLDVQARDMEKNAQEWQERYHDETTRFEKEVSLFRQELNAMVRQGQEKQEEYRRMRKEVDEYHEMKAREKLLEEERQRKRDATIRIQAWWRGIMVRRLKVTRKRRRKKKKTKK